MLRSLILLLACFALSAAAYADETRDLVLVAGQSNAVGFNAKPSELPADAVDQKILFWWRCGDPPPDERDSTSGGKWTHLQAQPIGDPRPPRPGRQFGNFAQADGGFGPEIGFARTLFAKQHRPLAIVKVAYSGTSVSSWNHAGTQSSSACYRALVDETKAAIAAAKAQGSTLRPRALVWVQGESDASAAGVPLYEKALSEMIQALRKDLEAPQLIALLGLNTHFGGGKNEFVPKIVEVQQTLAAKDPRCVYVDTSKATVANAAHFDSAGTLEVGGLFAEALIQFEAKALR